MIIIPKSHPQPFYFEHPGTMLRRSWISPGLIPHGIPNRWVLSLYPVRQPMQRTPTTPAAAPAPNDPARNRDWFKLYMTSYMSGVMSDGQPPNNERPINREQWNIAVAGWNAVGGYMGHQYHSGQQFFIHLNMSGPPQGGPNWSSPPIVPSPFYPSPPPPPTWPFPFPGVESIQYIDPSHVRVNFTAQAIPGTGTAPCGVTIAANLISLVSGVDSVSNPSPLDAATSFILTTPHPWPPGQAWNAVAYSFPTLYLAPTSGNVI